MRLPVRDVLVHGAVGGLLAGAAVALWFLGVDLAAGEAFRTPSTLAAVYLGGGEAAPSTALVNAYTVLHFGVFAVLGTLTAWIVHVLDLRPGALFGLLFGIGVLNAIYYGGVVITGSRAFALLPRFHVIGANLAGGLVLMEYLRRVDEGRSVFGLEGLRAHPRVAEGLATGLLGAAAVAGWFFVLDLITRQPFFTPAALGSALLGGAGSAAAVTVTPGIVAVYTVLHLAAFCLAGLAFVWVAARLERTPGLWVLALLAFVVLEAVFVPALGLLGEWLMGALAWWAVGVGNLLAVATMGWWVWRRHPRLRRAVTEPGVASQASG